MFLRFRFFQTILLMTLYAEWPEKLHSVLFEFRLFFCDKYTYENDTQVSLAEVGDGSLN